jgi:hypothetical protein
MLEQELAEKADQIQCIVSGDKLNIDTVAFGDSQKPKLWDYADGVDTVSFLRGITGQV